MKTITSTAKRLGQFLAKDFRQMFGPAYEERADRLGSLARSDGVRIRIFSWSRMALVSARSALALHQDKAGHSGP